MAKNNVPQPPLMTPILDKNGLMTAPWANFLLYLYNWTAKKDGNAFIDADGKIRANTEAIAANASAISTNAGAISTVSTNLGTHVAAEAAHGSNGNIVGFNDFATEIIFGLVKKMANVEEADESTVTISGTLGSAPATYDQAYTQSMADLVLESKDAITQVVTDLNNAIVQLNELIDNSVTAEQMTAPPPPP